MTRPILSVSEIFIVTKRLRLMLPSNDDYDNIDKTLGWLNDTYLMKYSEQRHYEHSRESQEKYIEQFTRNGNYREIHTANAFIGTIAAHVDENNSVANVGILIGDKKEWGKGYGTEAWQAFCDHLLANGIRKIEAGCMEANRGMLHIFRKTGMFMEGRLTAHFLVDGKEEDCWQFARFK